MVRVNAESIPDIIGFGSNGTYVALGDGKGHFGNAFMGTGQFGTNTGWLPGSTQRQVIDINCDGYLDIVGFGTGATYVALGDGKGHFGNAFVGTSEFGTNTGWRLDSTQRLVERV